MEGVDLLSRLQGCGASADGIYFACVAATDWASCAVSRAAHTRAPLRAPHDQTSVDLAWPREWPAVFQSLSILRQFQGIMASHSGTGPGQSAGAAAAAGGQPAGITKRCKKYNSARSKHRWGLQHLLGEHNNHWYGVCQATGSWTCLMPGCTAWQHSRHCTSPRMGCTWELSFLFYA